MNFYAVQFNGFLLKLKKLLNRISATQSRQLQSHTVNCHALITRLIDDNNTLNSMSSGKLRLLSYELILFIAEKLSNKSQSHDQMEKAFSKNKILKYLVQIQNTLQSIKQHLNAYNQRKQNIESKKVQNNFKQKNDIHLFDTNLSKYQTKLSNLMSELAPGEEKQSKTKKSNNQKYNSQKNIQCQQRFNQNMLEEMYRIIEKKEKQINQLTHKFHELNSKNIEVQFQFKKQQQQYSDKINSLSFQLQEKNQQFDSLKEEMNDSTKNGLCRICSQHQKLNDNINAQKINYRFQTENNNQNAKNQHVTEETISSLGNLKKYKEINLSQTLEKVNSIKSFRRINFSENRSAPSDDSKAKKIKSLQTNSEQLYQMLLCQASTIEELF